MILPHVELSTVVNTITQCTATVTSEQQQMNSNTGPGVTGKMATKFAGLAGGLGFLTAVLTLVTVGVVLGWVWSCHNRIRNFSIQKYKLYLKSNTLYTIQYI